MSSPSSQPSAGCILVDGEPVEPSRARVPALDHGYLYGDGAFETLRTYGGRPFRLEAHLLRLEAALAALEIRQAPARAELARHVEKALARAGLPEAYVRLTVSRGVSSRGLDPAGCGAPTVVVAALPLRAYSPEAYAEGLAAALLWRRAPEDHPGPSLKSTSYQRNVLARLELSRRGAGEGFFMDLAGHVTEGTVSNVFAVKDGALTTPPSSVCLAGITRAEVLSIAAEVDIPARECPLAREALAGADEVFVTSSLAEVMPITRLEGAAIGDGRPGPLTRELHRRYLARARGGTVGEP